MTAVSRRTRSHRRGPRGVDAVEAVGVVIPARNEESVIPAALSALALAGTRLHRERPTLRLRIVVVADRCEDRTADAARRFPGVRVIEAVAGSAGAARAAGMAALLSEHRARGRRLRALWLATTDADSAVPAAWLRRHVDAARSGADLRIGGISPDPAGMPPSVAAAWAATGGYRPTGTEVYGANLGIRADLYVRIGGFAPMLEHEDVDLVSRARAAGARVEYGPVEEVLTSARLDGRTPGGFAGYQRRLVERTAAGEQEAQPA